MSINMPFNLYQLAYTSTSLHDFKKEDLTLLLNKSRSANMEASLTGVLLYKSDQFLQVLEGDKSKVTELFNKIKNDTRHYDVNIIFENSILVKTFPDWSMGLGISVEDEDLSKDPTCFNLVSIIPFCVRSLSTSSVLLKHLILFLNK